MTTPIYVTPEQQELWGPLDEMGLLVALKRLPGETNFFYKSRLMDVAINKPSAAHMGLLNSISRELSLQPYYASVAIGSGRVSDVSDEELVDMDAAVQITDTGLFYDAGDLTTSQTEELDPVMLTITLDEYPRYASDVAVVVNSTTLDRDEYVVDLDSKKVRIKSQDYGSLETTVTYNYRKYFPFFNADLSAVTIQQLSTSIDDFTIGGYKRIYFNIEDSAVNILPAANLPNLSTTPLTPVNILLPVYRLRLFEIYGNMVQDLYLNDYNHLYGTRMEGWAREIAVKAGITWKHCELDWSQWDILGRRYLGVLPHLYDNMGARYFATSPSDTNVYSYSEYLYYGGYDQYGLIPLELSGANYKHFSSGAGHGDSLFVIDLVAQET